MNASSGARHCQRRLEKNENERIMRRTGRKRGREEDDKSDSRRDEIDDPRNLSPSPSLRPHRNESNNKRHRKHQRPRRRGRGDDRRRRRQHFLRGSRSEEYRGSSSSRGHSRRRQRIDVTETSHTGIVSDDEGVYLQDYQHSLSMNDNREKARHRHNSKKSRSVSYHDDSVGHFRGGPGATVGEYKILRQVGLGTFGKVLECVLKSKTERRQHRQQQQHVAIKVVRNVKRYYDSALVEAKIIRDVNRRGGRGQSHCVVMKDTFSVDGHYCMVFENLGPSLYDFLKLHKYQPFPMVCVQDFAVQLLETLEFLHSFRLIHTDLKIENILLMNDREILYNGYRVPESTRIKVIDFGGACYDNDKKSSVINTRQYRAPEVILGTGWSMPSDMWSVGCILAELYSGELLFATHDNSEHLALIEAIVGYFPRRMVRVAQSNQDSDLARVVFDSTGRHRRGRVLPADQISFIKRAHSLESLIRREHTWFLDLLRMILVIDPHQRATAHESLHYLSRIRRDVVRCG